MTTRRGFITGLISFAVTAPAIVRATSLMPVKAEPPLTLAEYLPTIRNQWMDDEIASLYGRGPILDALPDLRAMQAALLRNGVKGPYIVVGDQFRMTLEEMFK